MTGAFFDCQAGGFAGERDSDRVRSGKWQGCWSMFAVEETDKRFVAIGLLKFAYGLRLNLSNAFAGDREDLADLF